MDDEISETPEPILSGPKRQHYLPRFYLKGFGKDDYVCVFDRSTGKIRTENVMNTGVVGHLYTMTDEQGRKRYEVESMLSSVESDARFILDKLSSKERISDKEREVFSFFLALSAFRTPEMMQSMKGVSETTYTSIAKIVSVRTKKLREEMNLTGENSDESFDALSDMAQMIDSGELQFEKDNNHNIVDVMKMAENIAPILEKRNWIVAHAPANKSFITSDAPFILTKLYPSEDGIFGFGFASPNASIAFPLTQSCALMMYGYDEGLAFRQANPDFIRLTNLGIADCSQRFLIGRDEKLLASIAKARSLENRKWQPKIVSVTGGGLV